MKAYNQKIIETPTYIEIYDYDTVITPKRKNDRNDIDLNKKHALPWIYEQNDEKEKRKNYDELSAEKQYNSLKRKQQYYKNKRFEIARLVDTNFDNKTKFLTLTFKENIQEIDYANNEFKKFIKRLNYYIYHNKKAYLKYLATWEKQKRGAIHYHIILFNFPYISFQQLTLIWGHGYLLINKIDVDSIENRGRYVSKYFDKELEFKEHKKKAFFSSRNLKKPKIKQSLVDKPFELSDQTVIYSNEYLVKRPIFLNSLDDFGMVSQEMDFQECIVRYIKIKKFKEVKK
ncbi:Rep protein [Enterococcus faecalis]|uniref:rolling circle replication-associated protein n=1 Tax=Enterococcus faecalis TaxID=1351 RepID=UPI0020917F1C|nr:Rep protein [Enterococcus faecalis]MCO5447803.1 Rep protein [Enterococcus faecalis]